MRLGRRRTLLLVILVTSVLVGVVTVRVMDVHPSPASPTPDERPIPADATAEEILDRGVANIEQQRHTTVVRLWTVGVERESATATVEYRHDPTEQAYLATFVAAKSGTPPSEHEWSVGATYVHDTYGRTTSTTVKSERRPNQTAALADPEWGVVRPRVRPEPAFYVEGYRVFDEYDERGGWSTLSRNESTVVVGAANTTDYARLSGGDAREANTDDDCSLRVFVDVDTGRITRISERYCLASETRASETVVRDYGATEVHRPSGLGWPTIGELVTDFERY